MENNTKKRGRPQGSLNKPKSPNYQVLEMSKDFQMVTKENVSYNFINWGSDNRYPQHLLELYAASPTMKAAIEFCASSILGEGVDYDAMQLDGTQTVPNYRDTWDTLIRNLALDYMLYGSYALEIIRNKDGKTFSFWHIPLDQVRCAPYDEDGEILYYYISSDWSKISTNPPIKIDAFDMKDSEYIESSKPYVYVFHQYSPTTDYYSVPIYASGIKAIQAEVEMINYDLKSAVNSFTPLGALVLKDVETDEQRRGIIDNIGKMFRGSDNANSVLISFRQNEEETIPQFVPFTTNATQNVNLFESANKRTIDRILASFRIPNSSLIGVPDLNNNGFSSEADKMETGYQIYEKLSGNANRLAVIGAINSAFKMNGVDVEIIMKPLRFNDFDKQDNVASNTKTPDKNVSTDDEDIEEKVLQ